LLRIAPDVFLVSGNGALGPLLQVTRAVPIVFAVVADPVGSGFVDSLSRPGGSATGFMQFEFSLSAKWPELLKQIAPTVRRVAVLWDPAIPGSIAQFAIVQSAASSMGVEISPVSLRDFEGVDRRCRAQHR
jgi:putative tryptophan/tyrosine transport system substrate-binding protein